MEGAGVNTYMLINKAGKAHYVKFHWKPTCGIKCLLDEEAIRVGGSNHSHATKDLYDSIAAGNYPQWNLFVQVMDPAHEDKYDFDPLDVTKIWPEDILPLQPVGRLVLNKNIDNFFNENEQIAFCPALVVPGIHYSDDKLLQTRIFSYADSQRHRLGPNYLQLPVNAPKCAHHNNHHDGFMNFMHRDEEVIISLGSGNCQIPKFTIILPFFEVGMLLYRSITSLQGWIQFAMPKNTLQLLSSALEIVRRSDSSPCLNIDQKSFNIVKLMSSLYHSASLGRKTTSSSQGRDTGPGIQTGKHTNKLRNFFAQSTISQFSLLSSFVW